VESMIDLVEPHDPTTSGKGVVFLSTRDAALGCREAVAANPPSPEWYGLSEPAMEGCANQGCHDAPLCWQRRDQRSDPARDHAPGIWHLLARVISAHKFFK
jgi:hypothetical protein